MIPKLEKRIYLPDPTPVEYWGYTIGEGFYPFPDRETVENVLAEEDPREYYPLPAINYGPDLLEKESE